MIYYDKEQKSNENKQTMNTGIYIETLAGKKPKQRKKKGFYQKETDTRNHGMLKITYAIVEKEKGLSQVIAGF